MSIGFRRGPIDYGLKARKKPRGAHSLEIFRGVLPVVLVSAPLNATITAPIAYVFLELSTWSVLFFVAPAVVAQRLFLLYQEQRELASNLTIVNARLERANLSFARSLVTALDARDHYTAGHSAAVEIYARDIASTLSLSEEDQATTHLAGLLHDIGKVGLPPGILEKPGALTPEERTQMQEHSAIGERILRSVEDYAEIATFVRHHQERVDGKGYPDGLQRDHIPLISRVLCVADAYNAMTSGRPYRAAMPTEEARQRLIDAMGTQFDEDVVVAFEHVLAHATDLYSLGASADFALEAQAHREFSTTEGLSARPGATLTPRGASVGDQYPEGRRLLRLQAPSCRLRPDGLAVGVGSQDGAGSGHEAGDAGTRPIARFPRDGGDGQGLRLPDRVRGLPGARGAPGGVKAPEQRDRGWPVASGGERFKALYRARAAVEREFGWLKHEFALAQLRVRGLERVRLHADLCILTRLAGALIS